MSTSNPNTSTSSLGAAWRRNISTIRSNPFHELAGAAGDLGTYLPILLALSLSGSVSLQSSLIFNGIANVVSGLVFGLPVPVQPMKAIAAVALLRGFSRDQTMVAGLFVAAAVGLLAVTGALKWVNRIVPIPVVKGIQLGAGLSLVLTSGGLMRAGGWILPWADNHIWTLAFFLIFVFTVLAPRLDMLKRVPFALFAILVGTVLALIVLTPHHWPSFSLAHLHFHIPIGSGTWRIGILDAGIGQLPLTTLNSIIALHHLTLDLFDSSPGVTQYGISVFLINIGVLFGAMPICHGSGGLASQHLFGSRSGASVMLLGLVKIVLGVVTGNTLVRLLGAFPRGILGVLVFAAGLELARAAESLNEDARDLGIAENEGESTGLLSGLTGGSDRESKKRRFTVMLATAGALLAFRNDGIGLVVGLLVHWALHGKAPTVPSS